MSTLLSAMQLLVGGLFLLVGLAAAGTWVRDRRSSTGWLAVVIGGIALVAVVGRLEVLFAGLRKPLSELAIAAFLLSGYAMLRFRGTFIPLSRRTEIGATAVVAAVALAAIAAGVGAGPNPTALQSALAAAVVLAWAACLADPLLRFTMASMSVPAVQRARLRSLATAFAALAAILLAAVLAPALAQNTAFELAVQVIALVTVPLLYFSFAPPRWLRAIWRGSEEEALRAGMRQLLLFSPNRKVLAERAIEGAIRLVGGNGAAISDGESGILAARGLSPEQALQLIQLDQLRDDAEIVPLTDGGRSPRSAIIVPLSLSTGTGALIVTSGPFTPYFGADEIQRLRGFATSITAGLDRTLLTERLAALEKTKSQFLNLASHELRGPITVLKGYLSLLSAGSFGDLNPALQDVMPVMEQKAEEMNALVEQMIEAARLEEGRIELRPVDADLRELVVRAVEMARPLADHRHHLVVEQPPEEVRALIDVDRVSTILGNLLSNAIKYSPAGGQVRCRVIQDDGFAVVAVSDEGIGIPPELMDKLFTRFGRLVRRETEHIAGTGLGLYLSRELARLHGGDLTVESSSGRGSTFALRLPLQGADPGQPPPAATNGGRPAGLVRPATSIS